MAKKAVMTIVNVSSPQTVSRAARVCTANGACATKSNHRRSGEDKSGDEDFDPRCGRALGRGVSLGQNVQRRQQQGLAQRDCQGPTR